MLPLRKVYESFRYFYQYKPGTLVLLFVITLFVGFNQGASIAMLIPILNQINAGSAAVNSSWFFNLFTGIGVEPSLTSILTLFMVLIIATAVLSFVKARVQTTYEQGFIYDVRHRLFKKIIHCDWLTINSKSKHGHIQVLTNEIPKMISYYYSMLRFISGLIIITAHIVVSFLISAPFTLMVAATGIILFWGLRKFLTEASLLGSQQVGNFRRMIKEIDDFWIMIKQAKIHNSENFYFERFDKSNLQAKDIQNRQSVRRAVSQLIYSISGVLALALLIYLSVEYEHLSLSTLIVLVMLFARIFPLFVNANNDLNIMLSGIGSAELVIESDLKLPDVKVNESNRSELEDLIGDIKLRNISFYYTKSRSIFENKNMVIPHNKITGITGNSGVGKTTLIDIISGLIKPHEGEIIVGEKRLDENNIHLWQHQLGYLPQDAFFVDGTIRENLIWDSKEDITDSEITAVLEDVCAADFVGRERNGINTFIVNYSYHFSGGERQRLALARVLLRKPKYLILDEATAGLDSETEAQIMKVILQLKNTVTIIIVTHNRELKKYFDVNFHF